MYCTNCGAALKDTDVKCPYCGTINPFAAEADYMNKLKDLREDVDDLDDLSKAMYVQNLKKHSTHALRISLSVVAVFLFLFVGFQLLSSLRDRNDRAEQRAELAFREEYFPVLDELYAKGDDQAVWEYINQLLEEEGSSALFSWEHEAFYVYYDLSLSVSQTRDALSKGKCTEFLLFDGFYAAMQLLYPESYLINKLSAKEVKKINPFIQEATALLMEDLHLTKDDISHIYESCSEDKFLDYSSCRKYAKENFQDFISEE